MFFKKQPFRIRFRGRGLVVYSEGDYTVEISAEMGQAATHIHTGSIRAWLPPHDHEVLTEEDRKRIVGNLKAELCKQHWNYIFV